MRRLPGRLGGSWPDRLEVWVPALGYLLATVTGASTSSLGMPLLRQDPAHPLGRQWGAPQPIRSDEWLTAAPLDLGVLVNGLSTHSPLAQDPDLIYQTSSGGIFETLLFLEGNLLRLGPWLPDAMLFAAFRAFPILLLMLTLPPLLRRFGATRAMSWLAVVLVVLAPSSVWWSFMPVRILAFASAGSYLLVLAKDALVQGHRVAALAAAVLAGGSLARLPSYYIPWSLVIGVPLALATGLWLVLPKDGRRAAFTVIGVGTVVGLALVGGMWWDNLSAVQAELATVYPGSRRTTGTALDPYLLFGAPGLFELQSGLPPVLHNASEVSSAFTVCALWALVLVPLIRRSPELDRARLAVLWVLAGWLLVWLARTMIAWGSFGERVPLLNLVAPMRASQTMGFLGVLLIVLILSYVRRAPALTWWAVMAAGACAGVTLVALRDLRRAVPTLSTSAIVLCTALTGVLVLAVTRWPRSWVPVLAATLTAGAAAYRVNPIIFGLGDLRTSTAAGLVRDTENADVTAGRRALFVADDDALNALLVANGVPSLSGYQVTGPVREQWAKLDPTGAQEGVWNRGASYLRFTFRGAPGTMPTMSNPSPDAIVVGIDPCQLVPKFGVTHVLTFTPLTTSCTSLENTMQWSGRPAYLYRVTTV